MTSNATALTGTVLALLVGGALLTGRSPLPAAAILLLGWGTLILVRLVMGNPNDNNPLHVAAGVTAILLYILSLPAAVVALATGWTP